MAYERFPQQSAGRWTGGGAARGWRGFAMALRMPIVSGMVRPMPTSIAEGILLDLRQASVDDPLGRTTCARAVALLRPAAHGRLAELPMEATSDGAPLHGLRPGARRAGGVRGGGGMTSPTRVAGALALTVALAGCARDAEPTTFAVPRAAAVDIRLTCPPGTLIGTMTVDCPQPLSRAGRPQ